MDVLTSASSTGYRIWKVTKQAVTGLVERLHKGGYLEMYKDSNDRRITRLHLTLKGEDTLQATRPKIFFWNWDAFSILSKEGLSQLSVILPKVVQHLKNVEL